jgi:hypothetical protein
LRQAIDLLSLSPTKGDAVMTAFDDREKAFENKFKLDEELRFKAMARRAKLLGQWAAEQMGLAGSDAEAYAKSVVMADMEQPGDDDLIRKVSADLTAKKIDISNHRIEKKLEELSAIAVQQIMKG